MARKPVARTAKPSAVQAENQVRDVKVRVTRSFDYWVINEEFWAPLTERTQALISGGFFKVVDHGTSEAGQGSAHESDQGRSQEDAAPEGSSGAEQGEDPSSR